MATGSYLDPTADTACCENPLRGLGVVLLLYVDVFSDGPFVKTNGRVCPRSPIAQTRQVHKLFVSFKVKFVFIVGANGLKNEEAVSAPLACTSTF